MVQKKHCIELRQDKRRNNAFTFFDNLRYSKCLIRVIFDFSFSNSKNVKHWDYLVLFFKFQNI